MLRKILSALVALVVGGNGLALTWKEGWELVAKAQNGDRSAIETLVSAYNRGDPEAATALGTLFLQGIAYTRDYRKAWEYFSWARNQGSGWASAMLAIMYANGYGVQPDTRQSVIFSDESLRRGYPGGKATDGTVVLMGLKGRPTEEDMRRAVQQILQAADTGEPIALSTLARLYLAGNFERYGVPKDWPKAVRLWEEALEKGYMIAGLRLIAVYYYGYGVPPDQAKAIQLAEKLAGFGSLPEAYLATAYYFGVAGKPKDPQKACGLASKTKDEPQGMAVYGLCILENHLSGSRATGYAWILKATGLQNNLAKALAEEWEKKLPKADVEEAKRLLPDLK